MTQATILLVDDTPTNLQLLRGILEQEGYKVRAFSEGSFALESAKENPPDLILLDIKMPEMDGYEMCQYLKANECLSEIPVIFISALQDTDKKIHGFSLGAVDYITKPFQAEEVLARVRTHIALQFAQTQLREQQKALEYANEQLERRVQQRTAELSEANRSLHEEIEEREMMEKQLRAALREVHHRTKNNMQVIESLLDFQSMYTDNAHIKEICQEIRSRIQSMALVHE